MKPLITFVCLLFLSTCFSQEFHLNDGFSIQIKQLKLKKLVRTNNASFMQERNFKFLSFEALFKSKSGAKIRFNINEIILKTNTGSYMAKPSPEYSYPSSIPSFITLKKKKRKILYFDVPDTFSSGDLMYKDTFIGHISIQYSSNNKEALCCYHKRTPVLQIK